ncbi:conjugal transfer protein [Confluentibacter flavum]|uniref:Conjugal transfer protein n=1 Tax=Confluentibacter flavum TaxID=1909700 RepID=A0A2N3HH71_9FLAO|nr:conjugal transfer protein [Confluentibacter flavum]PKQ44232.1 conjugal transfer protein [Confluentibacter flavum]
MKNVLKKTIAGAAWLLLLSISGTNANAQGMPVYDNTNFISLAKSLVESAKQTSELLKTVEFLKQQKERIEKVSNIVKQLNAVKKLTRNNQRLFDMVQNDLRELLNSPYIKPGEVNRISESFNAIIEQALDDLDFVSQLLSNNTLNMTDAERAQFLNQKELESREMVAEIEAKTRRYREIIAFRNMQDKINNRTVNY